MLNKINFILTGSEKKKILLLLPGMLFLAVMEMFNIGIIIPIMNLFMDQGKIHTSRVLSRLYQFVGANSNTHFLTILIAVALIAFIFKTVYAVFIFYKQRHISKNINLRLTTDILTFYLTRPYAIHLESNSAILFRNITNVVNQFSSIYLFSIIAMSTELVVLVAIFCLLITIYAIPAMVFTGFLCIALFIIDIILKRRIKRYAATRMRAAGEYTKFGLEALNAVKEIKMYNSQEFFVRKYQQAVDESVNTQVKFNVISRLPRYILELVLWSSMLIALLINMRFQRGFADLVPMMAAFALAALRILPSANKIYAYINNIKYHTNTLGLIHEIVKEEKTSDKLEKEYSKDTGLFKKSKPLILENVNFSYNKSGFSLFEGLNLTIPSHKTVAFVGMTGAGKSTLIDILMGLLHADVGVLRYGDTVITPENILEYRKSISYVPQSIFLIDDTLERNIAFGVPDDKIDRKQLERVIGIVQLESFVRNLPHGIKTMVGEKGVKISGGQRQRVAIARALYHDPEILVMDEATSALDGYTEAELTKAIKSLYGKLTIIIIAHRLSTVGSADTIYVMEQGKIVDNGTFKELSKRSSVFKKIANQIIDEEKKTHDVPKE